MTEAQKPEGITFRNAVRDVVSLGVLDLHTFTLKTGLLYRLFIV